MMKREPVDQGLTAEAAQAPQLANALAIDDVEGEAELALQLVLPLVRHGGRRRDDDQVDAASQQQLARDQARLDRLAEADVVGDQQVDARQPQRLAQRQQLVGVEPDAGTERGLQKIAVGSRGGAPTNCAQVRRKNLRTVRAATPDVGPSILWQDGGANLRVPQDLDLLALGIIGDAGEPGGDERRLGVVHGLDEPRPASHFDKNPLLNWLAQDAPDLRLVR